MRFARTGVQVAALAVVGATALAACGKSTTSSVKVTSGYSGIPAAASSKVPGGVVSWGMPSGDTPNWIFAGVVPGADASVYNAAFFESQMWEPLWTTPVGHTLAINFPASLAKAPVYTNSNKTATVTLNSDYTWSDGAKVTAQDIVFDNNLIQAAVAENPANFADYAAGFYPQDLASVKVTSPYTAQFQFTSALNPPYRTFDELGSITPMPLSWDVTKFGNAPDSGGCLTDSAADKWAKCKAVYNYLYKQSSDLSTYATNPIWQVVDGPYRLSAFSPSTGANTLVPNTSYTGPGKSIISKFEEVAYTSDQAEFDALRSGALTVGLVPSDDYPQIPSLESKGYHTFGYPDFGWDYMYFNFADKTDNWSSVIGQLYVRQALAHLVDDAGIIKSVDHGYAVPADGPVPSAPQSPYAPANAATPIYPFSVSAAKALLASHGWKIVNGVQTCAKPGSGSGDCGAGIPSGQTLTITLYYNSGSPAITSETTAYASDAKSAGIPITLKGATFNNLIADQDDPADATNINGWQMADFGGFTIPPYPTTNVIFNTGGTFNMGDYSSKTADADIHNSVYGNSASDVKAEASFIATNLPALFQPEADHVYAWSDKLSGPQASFWEIPQFGLQPNLWYYTK